MSDKNNTKTINTFKIRIVILIVTASIITLFILLNLLILPQYERDLDFAKQQYNFNTLEKAEKIKKIINLPFEQTELTVNLFQQYKNFKEKNRRTMFSEILMSNLSKNDKITAAWTIWEPNSLDNLDSLYRNNNLGISGRYMATYFRFDKEIKEKHQLFQNEEELYFSNYYILPQKQRTNVLLAPYNTSYSDNKFDQIQIISAITPITEGYKFLGVVGIDINTDYLKNQIIENSGNNESTAMLITNDGIIAAHPNKDNIGKKFQQIYPNISLKNQIHQQLTLKKPFEINDKIDEKDIFFRFTPIEIRAGKQHWFFASYIPLKNINQQAIENLWNTIYYFGAALIFIFLSVLLAANRVSKPLERITKGLNLLALGNLNDIKLKNLKLTSGSELKKIAAITEQIIINTKISAQFAADIAENKLETKFKPLSSKDILGTQLLKLQEKLKEEKSKDEEYQEQENLRKWKIEGIAKFSSILRTNLTDIHELADTVLANVISYIDAQIGGIFIYKDDDKNDLHLELVASYAYDRKKYLDKKIAIGEGLIGACAQEKKTIFLKTIPDNYINISTGLGQRTPNSLLVVPLLQNQQIFGILELASVNTFQQHQIKFLEELAASITSTLITVKVSNKTSELLQKTQQQSEELQAQEEEMRQNLEEMRTTQEVSRNREIQLEGLSHALNASSLVAEFSKDGVLQKINDKFMRLLGVHAEQIIGRKANEITPIEAHKWKNHLAFWKQLTEGKTKQTSQYIKLSDIHQIWINSVFSPIFDNEGNIEKIIQIATDITPFKEAQIKLKNEIEEISKQEKNKKSRLDIIEQEKESLALHLKQLQIKLNDKSHQIIILNDQINQLKNKENDV